MPELSDDLMRELMTSFQVEAAEHLDSMNQSLLQLERSEDNRQRRDLIQEAFRAAHSLKGAARAVSRTNIESLAHSIENVLQVARNTSTPPEPEICDVLYEMLDMIRILLDGADVDVVPIQTKLAACIEDLPSASVFGAAIATDVATESQDDLPENEPGQVSDTDFRGVTDDTIRVSVSRLDTLMAHSGELVVSRISAEQRLREVQIIRQQLSQLPRAWREVQLATAHLNGTGEHLRDLLDEHQERLQEMTRSLDRLEQKSHDDFIRMSMLVEDLQTDVRSVRMLPVSTIMLGLELAVRDAARIEGKRVRFDVDGSDVELDRKILETLKDPLLHLVRNAVSHGIEAPAIREAAGKSGEGHLKLKVRQRGSEVSLIVSDDGQGFNFEALRKAGSSHTDATTDDILSLAFLPGITTSQQLTSISGRGVGLDIVRKSIEDIHGRIAIDTSPDDGTTITLTVPASLAITRALLVKVGKEQYALPLLSIERIIEVTETSSVSGNELIRVDDTPLSLVPLASILERPLRETQQTDRLTAVIISIAEQRLAIQIDNIVTETELAVKPVGMPLMRVRNVVGAALMGNGEPIVMLNPADLIRSAHAVTIPAIKIRKPEEKVAEQVNQILVVDDSITTRTLEKNILEAAGYLVITAINGVEALKRLEENDIDLVVSDLEMPHMDGFSLTRNIREHAKYGHLPVILVTSLESEADKQKGMLAGADAYIVKRGFNQINLLSTIKQYLNEMD